MTTNSVVKAFSIIEVLSSKGESGVTDLSERLSLDKTTVYRLLSTLKAIGYVTQNQANQRYGLAMKFLNLARSRPDERHIIDLVRPYLEELSGQADEAVNLAVLRETSITYIDHIDSRHTIKVNVAVGHRFPAHTVAIGKAILAYMPMAEVRELFGGLEFEKLTPQSISSLEDLEADLVRVRQRGFAIDDEECSEGLYCVAAPILEASGYPVAGLSTGFPKFRRPGAAERRSLAGKVKKTAAGISQALGYKAAGK